MLWYYTLMRIKNKMKDFKVESKEWWEVVEEYFTKELEKNLAQHRVNERILRYKLEAYQKNFLDFIYGSPTSTKILSQNEEIKQGLVEQLRRKKYRLKNHKTSKVEQFKRRRYSQKYHRTLEEGIKKKKNQREFRNRNMWRLFQHQKKKYPRYNIWK